MAIGKYLSLEEARKKGLLGRFAKEHPSKGDKKVFDKLFGRMAKEAVKSSSKAGRTSKKG
jgi:hypothetical protein